MAAVAVLKALQRLSPPLRAAATVVAALTVLALALGISGWMKPLVVKQAAKQSPEQSLNFFYSAKVPISPAYDGTTVDTPDPVFRKLANRVDLITRYQGPAGALSLTAVLTNGTGWHTTLTLANKRSFPGPSYDATIPLDFPTLTSRADDASRAIGAPASGSVTVALSAAVESAGLPTLNATMQVAITPFEMSLAGSPRLQASNGDTPPSDIVEPRTIRIFGWTLMTASQARSDAILSLIIAALIALVIFLLARRRQPMRTRVDIESRYAQLLVHVEPMPSPPGKPVVNVDNFPALVRLAERYGQMILTWRRPEADDFVVRDDGITYRYRVLLDEPTLQNVEHIDRPPGAGIHRRTASSEVS